MNNFQKLKISDVCDFIGGSQPPKSEFSNFPKEGYIRLVQTRDFKTDNFITYIPKDSTSKFFDKTDIMIGRYGPPIFQIFRGMEGAYNVALLKAMPKPIIIKDYLYYFLLQKSVFEYVDKLSARTGGQTGVDLYSLYKYPINLPDIENQKKIAKVLSDLDAKIELNNKINTELEAMAKTLYDYWFVQFDFPNENGKPYKSSGGKMVRNEELKREIPEGWEVKELEEIAKCIMGQSPKGESYNFDKIGVPLLNGPADYENGVLKGRTYTTEPTRLCQKDDLVLCIRATIGNLVYSEQEFCLGRGVAAVRPIDKNFSELIYFLLLQEIERFKIHATGSIIVGITKDDLIKSKCLIPSKNVLNTFHKLIKPQFNKIRANLKENQELASLRDWLLPMLMNGQVSVGNVEEQLGMVAESGVEYKKS